jgi:hypothetical protein
MAFPSAYLSQNAGRAHEGVAPARSLLLFPIFGMNQPQKDVFALQTPVCGATIKAAAIAVLGPL